MSDEEYVRSVWGALTVHEYANSKPYWIQSKFEYIGAGPFSTKNEMWAAAAEFTRERLEQIRQVEEECCIVIALATNSHDFGSFTEGLKTVLMRILAREQAALAELKQGMKDKVKKAKKD